MVSERKDILFEICRLIAEQVEVLRGPIALDMAKQYRLRAIRIKQLFDEISNELSSGEPGSCTRLPNTRD